MDLRSIRLVTFDCFGTLVDWETGICEALVPVARVHGVLASPPAILAAYLRAEQALQAGRYLPYREVLRRIVPMVGTDLGFVPDRAQIDVLVDGLEDWPLFGDTVAALRRCGEGRALGVLSNIDEDLFAGVKARLEAHFDLVVLAEHVRAYKPAEIVFTRAQELATQRGLLAGGVRAARAGWLHCSVSVFHDLVPARRLGIPCAWIRRPTRMDTEPPVGGSIADLEVEDLATLAARFDAEASPA